MVYDDLHEVWNAWWDLHGARGSNGFGPVPLAPADLVAYLRLHVCGARRRREWWVMLRRMDDAWLAFARGGDGAFWEKT